MEAPIRPAWLAPYPAITKARFTPTTVTEQFTGYLADSDFNDVDSRHDFIVDQGAFAELWNEWNTTDAVPSVDFTQNIVVVAVVPGPNQIMMQPTLDANGNLMLKAASTRMGGPGFSYSIQIIPSAGIESVNFSSRMTPPVGTAM
mgnify:CR=1 FL=1